MRFSLTKIENFEQCGQKYKFRYIDRIPENKNMYATRGTALHENIEKYLKGEGPLEDELEYYRDYFDMLKGCGITLGIEHEAEIGPGWQPLRDGEEPMLVAKYDLYMKPRDIDVVTIDWKTGKKYPAHLNQKRLYSGIIFASEPEVENITFTHSYLDSHENDTKTFTREKDFLNIKAEWDRKMDKVERAHPLLLVPKPQFLCEYCGYRKAIGGPCQYG